MVAQSSEQPSCLHVQADKNLNPSTRDYAGSFAELLRKEDYEFSLKQLSEYVTASLVVGRPLLDRKPALSSAEWTAALAGSTAYICRKLGHTSPAWTRIPQLPFPWFPSEAYRPVGKKMKELTKQQTPQELADLNVFIRERSLNNV